MQTTQKKDEEIRMKSEAGPVQFVDAAHLAARQAGGGAPPTDLFAASNLAAATAGSWPYPNQAILIAQPSYGLPPAPQFSPFPQYAPFAPPSQFGMQAAQYPTAAQPWPTNALSPQRFGAGGPTLTNPTTRLPLCDIVDEGAEYVCQLELPGVKRENANVACFERSILVTAQAEPDVDVGALVQSERGATIAYRRAINLPGEVEPSGAKATLRDGILTINVPKSNPTEGPRRIPIGA